MTAETPFPSLRSPRTTTPDPKRLRAEQLAVGYRDRPVITDLDLDVPPGEVTAIIGPNGCGKSTLLRAFGRLLRPRSGTVLLDGGASTRCRAGNSRVRSACCLSPRSRPRD